MRGGGANWRGLRCDLVELVAELGKASTGEDPRGEGRDWGEQLAFVEAQQVGVVGTLSRNGTKRVLKCRLASLAPNFGLSNAARSGLRAPRWKLSSGSMPMSTTYRRSRSGGRRSHSQETRTGRRQRKRGGMAEEMRSQEQMPSRWDGSPRPTGRLRRRKFFF